MDRPIFLVGCCKSGTTMLASLILQHPDVGPKHQAVQSDASPQDQLNELLIDESFNRLAHEMEQKEIWDRFFPQGDVRLRIGREMKLLHNPLSRREQRELVALLTRDFEQARFFSKHPSNCYRLHLLREMFPNAKLIAVHRDGRDVVASWGRKGRRWKQFGGYESAIRTFAEKWSDAVAHIQEYCQSLDVGVWRYESIIANPRETLAEVFRFCELSPIAPHQHATRLRSNNGLWRERIPAEFHDLVERQTQTMREQLGYLP